MEIIYVEMPISIEQKKEYNRHGYRVVDAQFAPEGYELPFAADTDVVPVEPEVEPEIEPEVEPEVAQPRRRRRRSEAEE